MLLITVTLYISNSIQGVYKLQKQQCICSFNVEMSTLLIYMEIKSEIKPVMKRTIYILPCRGAFIQLKKKNYWGRKPNHNVVLKMLLPKGINYIF